MITVPEILKNLKKVLKQPQENNYLINSLIE